MQQGAEPPAAGIELAQAAPACRVCLQEEDGGEPLCRPCACSGSMCWAHPACIQQWIDEKGDSTCEVCKQPYSGDFKPPPPRAARPGAFHEEQPDEQASALWCLAAVLVFMLLLLARHALEVFTHPLQPRDAPGSEGERADWRSRGGTGWDPTALAGQDPAFITPGAHPGPQWEGGDVSVFVVLAWLAVRCAAVLVPVLLVLRLMAYATEAQLREAESQHAATLRALEAGAAPRQPQQELAAGTPRGGAASLQTRGAGGADGGTGRSRSV